MGKKHKTLVVGTPGAYARTLERKHLFGALPFSVASLVAGFLAVFLALEAKFVFAAAAAVLFLVSRSKAESHFTNRKKARIGRVNEEKVAKVLKKCGADLVAHGQLLGAGGDCDHVVAGSCLVAVETKTGKGKVSYRNGILTAGRRDIPGDPIEQVSRQASALSKIAKKSATPVVVVTGMTSKSFRTESGVYVIPASEIASFLSQCPKVLTGADVRGLVNRFNAPKG